MINNINFSYRTKNGQCYQGDALKLLKQLEDNSVDLFITSPPFALLRKKEYGNKEQHEYVQWLAQFAQLAYSKLKETGSLVVDLGGAYTKGVPIRSLYNYRVLIYFCDILGYHLAEEFFWHNPSKLPSPIEWVNKRKIRVKDSVNTVWWFSKTAFPKADVKKVLVPYSDRMKKLINDPEKYYKAKKRPSGHDISMSFGKDNGGAIPPNLLQIPNSESNSQYIKRCKLLKIKAHPARFPSKLPAFFIKMLTEKNDLVIDFFSGSNTTGEVCENLDRRWEAYELNKSYVAASILRFLPSDFPINQIEKIYQDVLNGKSIDLVALGVGVDLFYNVE